MTKVSPILSPTLLNSEYPIFSNALIGKYAPVRGGDPIFRGVSLKGNRIPHYLQLFKFNFEVGAEMGAENTYILRENG